MANMLNDTVEGKLLDESAAVTAVPDRQLQHGHVLKWSPRSWLTKTGGTGMRNDKSKAKRSGRVNTGLHISQWLNGRIADEATLRTPEGHDRHRQVPLVWSTSGRGCRGEWLPEE